MIYYTESEIPSGDNISQRLLHADEFSSQRSTSVSVVSHSEVRRRGCGVIRACGITSAQKAELVTLISLSIPIILTSLSQFLIQSESIIMCGHLGKIDQDAATLANSLINVVAVSTVNGLLTASDTYLSQAFGMGHKKQMGLHFQRGMLMIYILYMLVASVILNAERIMLLLGQDRIVSKMAADYMLIVLPGIFCDFNFMLLARFMQNQDIIYPPLVIAFNANIFNVLSQYVAIYVYDFGFEASAICQASSMCFMLIQILGYIFWKKIFRDCWEGWSKEAFYEWGPFVRLGISGICMLAMEQWVFEASLFLAGYLGVEQLGAQSVLFQMGCMAYVIPLGLQVSVAIRVGQQVGNKNPIGARRTYKLAIIIITTTATIVATSVVALRKQIALIFTNDTGIINTVVAIIPLMAIYTYTDSLAAVGYGVMRGCGRQAVGGFFVLTGYYIVGIPIGVPLMFLTTMGIMGFWLGLLVGYVYVVIGVHTFLYRLDWCKECEAANVRVKAAESEISSKQHKPSETENEESALLTHSTSVVRESHSSISISVSQSLFPVKLSYNHAIFRQILMRRIVVFVIICCILAMSLYTRLRWPLDSAVSTASFPHTNETIH